MALAVESIGMLVVNLSLFAGGMALAFLALILAFTRSTTSNEKHWAILFAALAWCLALIIPNVWYAGLIFGMGAIALTFSFMPILEKYGDSNIFVLAIIAGVLNLTLLIGSGAYGVSYTWQSNYAESEQMIADLIGNQTNILSNSRPDTTLCPPNSVLVGNVTCETDMISGSFIPSLFVPPASILTVGLYLGKAVAFIGLVAIAPIVIGNMINSYIQNTIISLLMGLIVVLWDLAILYKIILFITGKYGAR